jgi:hypothetical protein
MKKIAVFILLSIVFNNVTKAQRSFPTIQNGVMVYIDSTGANKLITNYKRSGSFQNGLAR